MARRFPRTLGLCLLLSASAAPPLRAQGKVELKLSSRDLYVGEAVELAIQVSEFQNCEAPEVPAISGGTLRIAAEASESTFTSIVNGRATTSHSRTYRGELTPLAPGELTLPPIAVRVDGAVQYTQALKLAVKPSDSDQLLSVDISVGGRSRIYVGQRISLTMTIWLKPARYGNQLLDAGDMLRLIRAVELGPFNPQVAKVSRRPRPGGNPQETFYTYEFTTDHTADRPGQLTFENVTVGVAYPTPRGTRNLRAQPKVQPVEVLPVPTAGRPVGFAGAVGLFDIKVSAEPTSVRVGDPIELTIEIFGDGSVETLPPPALADNSALADGFRLPAEQLAGETKDARRRFKVTIRAKRDDLKEIPPIAYPYFDPSAERFVVARSAAIPLTVAPSAEVAAPEIAAGARPGGAENANLQALDGLRDIETSETAVLTSETAITSGLVTGAILAPSAVFLAVWGIVIGIQMRSADPARRRRQAALRTARRQLAQSRSLPAREMAGVITATLAGYLADRAGQPAARFTGAAAFEFLRGRDVPVEIVERWATLVRACDELAFAGGAHADRAALVDEAVACLKALERRKL